MANEEKSWRTIVRELTRAHFDLRRCRVFPADQNKFDCLLLKADEMTHELEKRLAITRSAVKNKDAECELKEAGR